MLRLSFFGLFLSFFSFQFLFLSLLFGPFVTLFLVLLCLVMFTPRSWRYCERKLLLFSSFLRSCVFLSRPEERLLRGWGKESAIAKIPCIPITGWWTLSDAAFQLYWIRGIFSDCGIICCWGYSASVVSEDAWTCSSCGTGDETVDIPVVTSVSVMWKWMGCVQWSDLNYFYTWFQIHTTHQSFAMVPDQGGQLLSRTKILEVIPDNPLYFLRHGYFWCMTESMGP